LESNRAEHVEGPGFNNAWVGKVTTVQIIHTLVLWDRNQFFLLSLQMIFVEKPQQKSGMGE
jgi:hypothetical protein